MHSTKYLHTVGNLLLLLRKEVPKALGIGNDKIDHSAYIEGNTQIGKVNAFPSASATLMVGRENTKEQIDHYTRRVIKYDKVMVKVLVVLQSQFMLKVICM